MKLAKTITFFTMREFFILFWGFQGRGGGGRVVLTIVTNPMLQLLCYSKVKNRKFIPYLNKYLDALCS